MELKYDISVVGAQQLRSVIRGVEQEILASNKRMTAGIRASGGGVGGGGGGRPRALAASNSATAESKALARVAISEDAKVWREKERQSRRFAQIEIRAVEEVAGKRLAATKREQALIRSMALGAGKTVGRSVMGVARAGAGAATLAGGVLIGSALHDQMQVQAYASRVANQGERPDLKGALATGSQQLKGFTGEEALSALDQFVQKSGNLKSGIDAWQMMGQVSLATSSDITEVGQAAGSAFNLISEQTKDPIEQLTLLKDVMETLAVQGNKGSIEMRDFATQLPALAASARQFGGARSENIKTVGALAQLAVKRGGATDAAEATTSISRFMDDLITDSKAGKKHGALNVFSDKSHTKIRDVGGIIGDVMDQTGGDLQKIQSLFGVRGRRAFSGVSPAYLDAFNAAEKQKKGTGKAAGRAAVTSSLGEFTGAGLGPGELEKRAQLRLDDPDLQIKESVKAFNVAIGTQLMPVMMRLIPQFTALVPTVADLAGHLTNFVAVLASNPLAGIGAVISAKVAKDVGASLVGEALKKAIQTQVGQAGGLVIGTAAVTVAVLNLIQASQEVDANKRSAAMAENSLQIRTDAAQEMKDNGKLSPATRKRVEALRDREAKRLSDDDDPTKGQGVLRGTLNLLSGGLTGPNVMGSAHVQKEVDASRADELIKSKSGAEQILLFDDVAKKLNAASDKLAAAGDKLASNDPARTKPIVGRN